jgi:DnaJ homolog subfamily A member 5
MRTLFATLDREEEAAARESGEEHLHMPSFGDSKSDPKHEVRQFYSAWISFSTMKSFSWKDQWKYSDAPDRRIKRAMEKDNKKHRDAARREFNDTVKVNLNFEGSTHLLHSL